MKSMASVLALAASAWALAAHAGGNGVIRSGPLNHALVDSLGGTSMNLVTGGFDDTGPLDGDWDLNFWDGGGFVFGVVATHAPAYAVDADGQVARLQPGDTIGPDSAFGTATDLNPSAGWSAGGDGYAGVRFECDGRLAAPVAGGVCYGYVHLATTGPGLYPASVLDAAFDGDGNAIAIGAGGPAPRVTVTPPAFSFSALPTDVATQTLTIANAADADALAYSITSSAVVQARLAPAGDGAPCTGPAADWLTAAPAEGSLAGGASVDVAVSAIPAAASLAPGSYTAQLCIATNDPEQGLIALPVSLEVTAQPAWTVTSRAIGPGTLAGHGTVSPASTAVDQGDTVTFTAQPDPGYVLAYFDFGACGGEDDGEGHWTTQPIFSDCGVSATFSLAPDEIVFQGDMDPDVVAFENYDLQVPRTLLGVSVNWETGANCAGTPDAPCDNALYQFRPATSFPPALNFAFRYPISEPESAYGLVSDADQAALPLASGEVVGPDRSFDFGDSSRWITQDGIDASIGFRFLSARTGKVNYGYAEIQASPNTTQAGVFPVTILRYAYDRRGNPITVP